MKKVLVHVEGQTEETFVRDVLDPYLQPRGLYLVAVIQKTRTVPGRPSDKGGYVPYERVKRQLLRLLQDTSATAVTTMYDLYGLPTDFPERLLAARAETGAIRASRLELALAREIGEPARFHPHIQPYEFEALLFAQPECISGRLGGSEAHTRDLVSVQRSFATPEDIDDCPATSPSHRIKDVLRLYDKVAHGPLVADTIGLDAIRAACPHFHAWVSWLESL